MSSYVVLVKMGRIKKIAIRLITNSGGNVYCSIVPWIQYFEYPLNLLHAASFMYKVYINSLPQYFIDMFIQ